MNEAHADSTGRKLSLDSNVFSLLAATAGALLILGSLLPAGNPSDVSSWTNDDSAAYERISQEYHRLSYESPDRSGLTEKQLETQRDAARRQFDALRAKLRDAQSEPLTWKRQMFWSGVLLAVLGGLGHFAGSRRR